MKEHADDGHHRKPSVGLLLVHIGCGALHPSMGHRALGRGCDSQNVVKTVCERHLASG